MYWNSVKDSKPDLIYFLKMFKEVETYINPKNLLVIRIQFILVHV